MAHLSLVQGPLRLVVDPAHGGIIRRFTLRRTNDIVELMRPMPEGTDEALAAASFPLVPFSNRIGHARFRFDGREITLRQNFLPEPHAIHGHGWAVPWSVSSTAPNACTIAYRHSGGDWPWVYRATQDFALSDSALTVRLTLTNLDPRPMPAGIGLHPYFEKRPGTRMSAGLHHMWTADDTKLPVERVPVDAGGPPMDGGLDNCFGGWDGRARLQWTTLDLALDIEADLVFGHLVIYVPSGEDHFCVEPVSHANNAVNLVARGVEGTGLRRLAQNESLSGTVRFRVRTLDEGRQR